MAIKTFNVEHYKISLNHELTATWAGDTIHARGKVVCYGDDHRLIAYFLAEHTPVPKPVYLVHEKVGAIFFPFREFSIVIDILRNEKPVYAYLCEDNPEWIGLGTFREPVGDKES